jgi:hypothetical protein
MTYGKNHDIEPDNIEDYLCAAWFEDMPETAQKEWHRDQIINIAESVGVNLSDVFLPVDGYPDYDEVIRRVHIAGWDTYDSDTRLIVFSPRPLVED